MHRPPQIYRPKRSMANINNGNNNIHANTIAAPTSTNQHQILHQPPPPPPPQSIPHSYQSNYQSNIIQNFPLPHLQHYQQHPPRRNFTNHVIPSKQQPHQQAVAQLQHPQQPQQSQQKTQNSIPVLSTTSNNTNIRILKHTNQVQQTILPSVNASSVPVVLQAKSLTSVPTSSKPIIATKQSTTVNSIPKVANSQQVRAVIAVSVANQPERTETNSQPKSIPVDLPKNEPVKVSIKESKNSFKNGQILQSTADQLANSKEKTPMCLVNELARYNKITHQYRLTGEQGPAHSKRFTVTLKLGDEEYTAEGPSIKKAQHTAAAEATTQTKYEHPPPKTVRHKSGNNRAGGGTITPTVELNALAMKLGEPTLYVYDQEIIGNDSNNGIINTNILQPQQTPNGLPQQIPMKSQIYAETGQYQILNNRNAGYLNGSYHHSRGRGSCRGGFVNLKHPRLAVPFNGMPPPPFARDACKITLLLGKKKFIGTGPTVQAAKHDAASRALEVLKPLAEESENVEVQKNQSSTDESNSDIKSPISVVHEMALKRNLNVIFEVKSETGPPHMKTFITMCIVGTTITEGEGNGKKISKKRAAEKMLIELRKLPNIIPEKAVNAQVGNANQKTNNGTKTSKGKNQKRSAAPENEIKTTSAQQQGRKKSKSLIKENSEPESTEEINPISKLIQIQQALKQKEPIYTVVEENGAPRRREFVIEVCAGDQSATGSGSNKKIAKRNAAKNLLTSMGYEMPTSPNKENDSNVVNTENVNGDKKINESSQKEINSNKPNKRGIKNQKGAQKNLNEKFENTQSKDSTESYQSESLEDVEKSSSSSTDTGIRPKDQLLYLAELLGFKVVFSDYPKGNHGEYLTIVTLSTLPPQICHGAGSDTKASQDKAAITALEMLSKLGLDNVAPKNNSSSSSDVKKTPKVIFAVADSSEN